MNMLKIEDIHSSIEWKPIYSNKSFYVSAQNKFTLWFWLSVWVKTNDRLLSHSLKVWDQMCSKWQSNIIIIFQLGNTVHNSY